MAYTEDFFEAIESINISDLAAQSIDDTKENIKDLQRDQLLHGLRGDGKKIGKYRSRKYAAAKNAMNPLAGLGNVDLKLTGAVHGDLFVDVREDEYVIDSADSKMGKLIEKYGDPLGLAQENEQKYIDETLEEAFIKNVEDKMGL